MLPANMIISLFLSFILISHCNVLKSEKPPNIGNLFINGINLKRHYSHLLCSVSRAQYLPGRYAMYMGQGGMLSYTSFQSVELKRFDMHEDGQNYNYDQLLSSNLITNDEPNALYLYRNKALQYIESEAKSNTDGAFYMYFSIQSPHGPLSTITKYEDICENILQSERNAQLTDVEHRKKYCEVMLLSDDIIGDIISSLKVNNLYDNTVIVMTTDTRTLAVISGGVIPLDQYHTTRTSLFSSLDWTPTLLQFAGIYDEINENDRTWDGINQYDLIIYGDNYSKRDHIVFNIGLRNLEAATIVFNYANNNKLYKYIASDRTINPENFVDERIRRWCVPNDEMNPEYFVIDSKPELLDYPDRFNDRYWLFNLDNDESELNNLFINNREDVNIDDIVDYAKSLLMMYVKHPLYSEHIKRSSNL
eukprot:485291_1